MKAIFILVLLACGAASAENLNCPDGTESAFERDKDVTVIFCRKWGEEKAGSKTKPILVKQGPVKITQGDVLLQTGQYEDNKPTGLWKAYYNDGSVMLEHTVDENLNRHGKFTRLHPNGKKRTVGQYDHGKEVGQWQFFSPEGTMLVEGSYDKVLPVIEKFDAEQKQKEDAEAAKAKLIAQKNSEKRQVDLKKTWEQKNKGKIKSWYDKKSRLYWSSWLGRSNWYNAGLKCKELGWRLATVDEFNQAVEHGLAELSDEMHQPFWSAIDQTQENDPQRSIVLGDHGAWVVIPGEGESPGNRLTDENSVMCVTK